MTNSFKNQYHHTRNYGCRFKEVIENGYRSLVLENKKIRVSVYLDKGSDIYEFLYKPEDIDFMWKSPIELNGTRNTPFTKESPRGNFLDIYEGGWQDMLPTIGEKVSLGKTEMGVHGELFTLPFKYIVEEDSPEKVIVKLFIRMQRTPFFVEKRMVISENSSFLEIEETVANEGDEAFNFSWGQHPAVGIPFLDENCIIDVPKAKKAKTYKESLSPNQVVPLDKEFQWPYIESARGGTLDLSKIMSADSKTAYITYLENVAEGWYGITNPKLGLGFGMIWDKNIFKHLWMWMVYRGVYGYPWYGRTYNIALEPWSSLPDNFDEVLKNKDFLSLKPGQTIKCKYAAIIYSSKKRISGFDKDFNPIF